MLENDPGMIRLKYKYRRLIVSGRIRLPRKDAVQLIGPDCAYHLFAYEKSKTGTKNKKR